MKISVTTETITSKVKVKQPNPFDQVAALMAEETSQTIKDIEPGKSKVRTASDLPNEAAVKTAVNQLRRAARAVGKTALVELRPDGKSFKFQLVPKITRTVKAKSTETAAA